MAGTYLDDISSAFAALDVTKPSFLLALAAIAFQPTWWNIVGVGPCALLTYAQAARAEYRTHFLTKLAGGPKRGVYLLSLAIISVGLVRDFLFTKAMEDQTVLPWKEEAAFDLAGYGFMGVGLTLVLTSTWALGWINTFLGDYFGLLMTKRVTGFPFNILSDPMYVGSTLLFIGHALRYRSVAGLVLSLWVGAVYFVALLFEGPFTTMIYSKGAAGHKSQNGKKAH